MSIPKIIHYCWFGEGEIPYRDKKCIESWKFYCPDYEIIEWNEKNYDVTKVPYMKEAYEMERWGFVTDYIRMDVVYRYGGIYLDTDVELIRPLDDLLEHCAYAGIEAETQCIAFGLGFGSEKGNRLLKELCDYYATLHFLKEDGSADLTPNPTIVTEYLRNKGYEFIPGEIGRADDFVMLPEEYFCPQNFFTRQVRVTDKTYSIHHYHASWKTEEEQKNFHRYCVYVKLFGNRLGELIYQTVRVMKEEGVKQTIKKIIGHFR